MHDPLDAVTQGVQGWVCIGFVIDAAGVPTDPQVLASAPAGVFDAAALAAVREWRFEPNSVARSGLRLPLLFALDPETWSEQMTRSENGR